MKVQLQNFKLFFGDMVEQSANIIDNSIDLIFTDPPYGFEYLYLYEQLAEIGSRLLKEEGSLVVYAPNPYLSKILDIFSRKDLGLKYAWIYCIKLHGNHTMTYGKKVFSTWKPVLWYVKGDKISKVVSYTMSDYIDSERPTKAFHGWEQSIIEAGNFIKYRTLEHQIILDPMMGSGTTGIAALKLNRKFIGIEINPLHYSNAERRLSATHFYQDSSLTTPLSM